MCHQELCTATEERQQVIDQSPLGGIAGDGGREDMKISDLFYSPHRLLSFQPVNGGLDCCVGRLTFLGKIILNFADRGLASRPKYLHNPEFQLRKLGCSHLYS